MKKVLCLSEQALRVLRTNEVKLRLMVFFEISDARTIESYLANNSPNGPLMNICIKELILEYAPYLKEKDIYRRLTQEEVDAMNKTKNELKRKYGNDSTDAQ